MYPSPGRGSDSDDSSGGRKRRTNGEMIVSPSSPALPLNASTDGQLTIVMQTHSDWRNRSLPIGERWAGSIVDRNYCTMSDSVDCGVAVSDAVLQQQRTLACNELWLGLSQLKDWALFNVHRILVPPDDPRRLAISRSMPYNALCVTMSQEACGVRSYLDALCAELRIDFLCVSGTYWEDGMMQDLLNEACRHRRRALILFDRTSWFSHAEYPVRGAAFMHHLRAAMNRRRTDQVMQRNVGTLTISNDLSADNIGAVLPNLWIVVSSTGSDVVPEVLRMARGATYQLTTACEGIAYSVVRSYLRTRLREYNFDEKEIEQTLSETVYTRQLQSIATLLRATEIGAIISIMCTACMIAFARDYHTDTNGQSILNLLPTCSEVQLAISQLSGQAVGVPQPPLLTSSSSSTVAGLVGAAINNRG